MKTFNVFTRRPWKRNKAWPGGWEPHGGARKRSVATGVSIDEARAICRDGNSNASRSKPGQMWYEFEST